MRAPSGGWRLVADIGGTHARFALTGAGVELAMRQTLLVADHPSLEAAIAAYMGSTGAPPLEAAAIAMAGPVVGQKAALTNGAWRFETAALARHTGIGEILVLNDYEALALSLPHVAADDILQIGGGAPADEASKAVIGPGTGFGGAVLLPGGGLNVMPSEIGHTALPVLGEREARIASRLADGDGHVPVENAVSGPGLIALYRQCAIEAACEPALRTSSDIIEASRRGSDPAALEAVDLFIAWLGRTAGDAALLYRADGGVYIGGGMAPKMRDLLVDGRLRRAFDRKGRMAMLVAGIPLYVITADAPALLGAAAALGLRSAAP